MINKNINYSIIIPHKNIPDLLQRCLSSIPRREDVEIIVIDDNSDPEIVNFNEFPGYNDPYIKLIFTKEGKGAGYSRNVGIKNVSGKWILFADADDYFNYCINDIFNEYNNSSADIIYFKHNCLNTYSYVTENRSMNYNTYIDYWTFSKNRAEKLLKYEHVTPWAKLIKKELIEDNNILFDEVYVNNDVTFTYLIGFYSNNIEIDKRAIYNYTIRNNSLSYETHKQINQLDTFKLCCRRYVFYKKNKIHISSRNIGFMKNFIKSIINNKSYNKEALNIFNEMNITNIKIILLCAYYLLTISIRKINKILNGDDVLIIFHLKFLSILKI